MSQSRPTIRLKPKSDARRLRHGFPWVYTSDLVADRRTRALPPGSIAVLEDAERNALATVTVNLASKIGARVLDTDPDADIGKAWVRAKLGAALSLRETLYDAPFYRLIHAEADGFPGLIIDRFGDAAVIQPNSAWSETILDDLREALVDMTGVSRVFKNASGRARGLEGLDDENQSLLGTFDEPVQVPMNGAIYLADIAGGQKTGLFFDQRDNHAFVASLSKGTRVLDVFSHVGGFGLAALAAGASSAHCVDGSAAALDLATGGAAAMGAGDRLATRTGDAFDAMKALKDEGAIFETVICDPPAFAPHKGALEAGLRAYEKTARAAADLVAPGGTLTLCSCSHAATLEKFRTACVRGIGRAGRPSQILRTGFASPDHPQHPHLAESGYLKAITFRLLP